MLKAIPVVLLAAAVAGTAVAQTTVPAATRRIPTIDELSSSGRGQEAPARPRNTIHYSLNAGVGMQSGGDEFDVLRANTTISASKELSPNVDVSLTLSYGFDNYDFDANSFFGSDVWGQVHTYGARANLDVELNSDWTLFFGPAFQVSQESGAEFDESWIGGAFAGLIYKAQPGVVIGGGVGIFSEIQDQARFQPIIILDWEISSDVRLTSRTAVGLTGVNVVLDLTENIDVAVGVSYLYKRFRMDDTGISPGGVGQETGVPVYLSGTYTLSSTSTISAYVGVVVGGEIEIENRDGGKTTDDYGVMGLFGLSFSMRF